MSTRTFSVQEANETIPLVTRIAEDVVRDYLKLSEFAAEYKKLRGRSDPDTARLNELKTRMAALSEGIDGYVAELQEIGCEMKGLDEGLVDFPSTLDGRRVYLCWRLGEPRVEFWHEVTAGFPGRQPLPVTVLEE